MAARRCARQTGQPGWRASTGRASDHPKRRHAGTPLGNRADAGSGEGPSCAVSRRSAERKFDDAVTTAKTMFALSRHLGEHPTEVANLVALWVSHVGPQRSRKWCSKRSARTCTRALTDLPSPPVDLRKGIQGEQTMITAELKGIRATRP